MLKVIEEFGKHVAIAGFTKARVIDTDRFLRNIGNKIGRTVEAQFFNAKLVATWEHLYFAALNSLVAFRSGNNISKRLALETILYASAQRQIRKATKLAGIGPTAIDIAVLVIGDKKESVTSTLSVIQKNMKAKHDDKVLEITEEKFVAIKKIFRISDVELKTVRKEGDSTAKALSSLVLERMALLSTHH